MRTVLIIIWSIPWLYGIRVFNEPDDTALRLACLVMVTFPLFWILTN